MKETIKNIQAGSKPFRIGICMAGAVSAGAYTAGVMDYLLEALAEWEKRKSSVDKDVPQHQVVIPIMGGASAGGMTAMLTATVLNNPLVPVKLGPKNQRPSTINNKLYESWVDLIADDMFPKLLSNSDIKPGKVESMLNATFIDDVAEKMICCKSEPWLDTPKFIETPLKLFTTLSNLEGFEYNTNFNSAQNQQLYNMSVHNDYACFELFDNAVNPALGTKGWIPLNFQVPQNIETAKQAAMATGAFPVGLKARLLQRTKYDVNNNPFLQHILLHNPVRDEVVTTLNVDGGMINNEPFDKVRDVLDSISRKTNPKIKDVSEEDLQEHNCFYSSFENTVIMIDPFPSVAAGKFDFSTAIPNVIGGTLSAMLSQMRAKPTVYTAANASGDASQYIISPSRKIPKRGTQNELTDVYGEKAIACGNLGGFGGFLHKDFREHDFYLGRFNCEIFLRDYFTIPEDDLKLNSIFAEGYNGVNLDLYRSSDDKKQIQIIPIFTKRGEGHDKFPMPDFTSGTNWPTIQEADIDRFKEPVKGRIQKVILNIAAWSGITKLLLFLGAKIVLNKSIAKRTLTLIKDTLFEWNLISDYTPESKASRNARFERSGYWVNWTAALVLTLLVIGLFRFVDFYVRGLVDAELAGSTPSLYEGLRPLIDENPDVIWHNLYLDFAFILIYSMLFYYSVKLFTIINRTVGRIVLFACLLPGLLDIVENIMMLHMLNRYSYDSSYIYPYFNVFHWIVVSKWWLAVGGIILVLFVAGKKILGKEEY